MHLTGKPLTDARRFTSVIMKRSCLRSESLRFGGNAHANMVRIFYYP
jgi:hypothetical protein